MKPSVLCTIINFSLLLFFYSCKKEERTLEVISLTPDDSNISFEEVTPTQEIPLEVVSLPPNCENTEVYLEQTQTNGATPFNGGSDYTSLGQTLTFNEPITLKSIELYLNATHASISAYLNVYSYNGGNPDLSQNSQAQAIVTDFSSVIGFSNRNWIKFEFDTPVTLDAGEYYLDLSTDANEGSGENIYVWADGTYGSDIYNNGKSFQLNTYGFWYDYPNDKGFRVHTCQ